MGWAEGLQSGLALGRAFKEGQERRKMEEIQNAAPTEMQGYTPAQGNQLQGLAQSGGYDIVPQYAPPAEGQTQGLFTGYQAVPKANLQDQAGWDTPAAAQTFAPQRVTEFLGQRYEGGLTPDRMEALRTRAMAGAISDPRMRQQMLMEATRAEREAQEAPLRQKALEQQVGLGGVQLTAAQRAEKMSAGNEAAQNALAELRSSNAPINSQTLAQLAKTHGADYNTLLSGELNQLGFNEKTAAVEMKNLSRDWSKAVLGGAPQVNKFLADKFDPDKTDNITPELVQTKAGYVVKYGDKILGEYGTHKDLSTLAAQVHGMINDDPLGTLKTLASVKASEAAAVASGATARYHDAAAGLTGIHGQLYQAQIGSIKDAQDARAEVAKLGAQFADLTPEEQNGPKGRGLIKQINIANVKAGGQVNLGPVEKPTPTMTKPQEVAWGLLQKSDPWLRAEQKGDTAAMNKLLVGRGIDPALIGLPGDAGWVPKPTAPAASTAPAAPAPALVKEDRTKYIREKGPLGGYIYTPSPRGMTKADYAAMDRQ